mgnify:CR=1 FL=1
MAQDKQIIPLGETSGVNVIEDTSMHGSNGSPMVEFPEDRIGPTAAAPNQSFYVYAPTIHWHTV